MADDHSTPTSANTRRRFIEYIVNTHLALNNAVWWNGENPNSETIAYREWALGREPTLRKELEAMSDGELRTAYAQCNDNPEWATFFQEQIEQQEKQQEADRQKQYHLRLSQKGGQAQPSRWQKEIVEACQDMYASNPELQAKQAYDKLSTTGHVIPDGKKVTFQPLITYETFRTKYWVKRKPMLH
jgi:hypothetical protein